MEMEKGMTTGSLSLAEMAPLRITDSAAAM
jgi:hypothetical protein